GLGYFDRLSDGTAQVVLDDDIIGPWSQIVKGLSVRVFWVIRIVRLKELAQGIRNGISYPSGASTGLYDDLPIGVPRTGYGHRFQVCQDEGRLRGNDYGVGYRGPPSTFGINIIGSGFQFPENSGALFRTHNIGGRGIGRWIGVQQGIFIVSNAPIGLGPDDSRGLPGTVDRGVGQVQGDHQRGRWVQGNLIGFHKGA